jgi:predicted amidohydrolase
MKFAPTLAGNLARIEAAALTAVRSHADAILFPECALTGYACDFSRLRPPEVRNALRHIARLAANLHVNLLVGSPVFRGRRLENCLVVFSRQGEIVHCYAKCHLTEGDRRYFRAGNAVSLFEIDGVQVTAIICHERRYPELVRLAVMAGAQILFHPNAGLDARAVSRKKHGGRDGIAVRAFENAIHYVFANSVGPQGGGKWSAGDSKIVAADGQLLKLAGNTDEEIIVADLNLAQATRKYALESFQAPRFLASSWRRMVALVRRQNSLSSPLVL